jgi:circadian clock protein KaiC
MAMEFLVRGITQFDEPGVFMAFEETSEDLAKNVRSLGFDLEKLIDENRLVIDHVRVERTEIEEAGEFDLEGLFLRLGLAIDSVGAKRVVLDTIETLFSGFTNVALLRSELRRLFGWLKERGVTAVITGERGEGALTRQGLEEYVSDCVILLDHRVIDQISTRRLRIVKYRGTVHGTNEYPFLIDEDGISVLPVTSLGLAHAVSRERISSGVPGLDQMLGGGFYRGSSILISGTAGTGKTSIAGHIATATCLRGERCLYFSFEESSSQISRNLESIGLDLAHWMKQDLLRIHSTRPTLYGLEMHLAVMHKQIEDFAPTTVIIDPVSSFTNTGSAADSHSMLIRLIDYLKSRQITCLMTSLTGGGLAYEQTQVNVSSIVDSWILMRDIELGGERNRGLYVLKSRGMAHSNQIREFLLTSHGIELQEVYVGQEGVLTGSMRKAQEAREKAAELAQAQAAESLQRQLERKRKSIQAQIAALQAELGYDESEFAALANNEADRAQQREQERRSMATSRKAQE